MAEMELREWGEPVWLSRWMSVFACAPVCVCVCVCERESQCSSLGICMRVCVSMCVCICMWEGKCVSPGGFVSGGSRCGTVAEVEREGTVAWRWGEEKEQVERQQSACRLRFTCEEQEEWRPRARLE